MFCLVSGILGWIVHYLASKSVDTNGPLVLVVVCAVCGLAICLGFLIGLLMSPSVPDSLLELGIVCLVCAIGTGTTRFFLEGN